MWQREIITKRKTSLNWHLWNKEDECYMAYLYNWICVCVCVGVVWKIDGCQEFVVLPCCRACPVDSSCQSRTRLLKLLRLSEFMHFELIYIYRLREVISFNCTFSAYKQFPHVFHTRLHIMSIYLHSLSKWMAEWLNSWPTHSMIAWWSIGGSDWILPLIIIQSTHSTRLDAFVSLWVSIICHQMH